MNHISCILYLDLHIYKFKSNKTYLILQNILQLPCATVANNRIIYETRKQAKKKKLTTRTNLAVQWLRLCPSTAENVDSIPDWETRILHATRHDQKKFFLLFFNWQTAAGKWFFITQESVACMLFEWKYLDSFDFSLKIPSVAQIPPEPSNVSKGTIHKR